MDGKLICPFALNVSSGGGRQVAVASSRFWFTPESLNRGIFSNVTRRHRRSAERRQIDSLQRSYRNARGRERQLSFQHHGRERRRRQPSRRATRTSGQNRQDK